MNRYLRTDADSWTGLIARIAIAITIFPHGAQKMLGWFGGGGFSGTMYYFTEMLNIPYFLGILVILVEFIGAILLLLGLFTRFAALGMAINFIGVLLVDIMGNGFFMNWSATAGQGEGIEYFLLLFGLIFISLLIGGGKASLDAILMRERSTAVS